MIKRILVDEDFNEDIVKDKIKSGWSVHVRSKRKIKRKDKKTYNKLKRVGLSEDNLYFGEVKQLDFKYNYDEINITGDPIMDKLMVLGKSADKYRVIKSDTCLNLSEAEAKPINLMKSVDLKFITIKTLYSYEKGPGVEGPNLLPTSRSFCQNMVGLNKMWTLDELKSISTDHLADMGLPRDVFVYRGGFYTKKGTNNTTPFCRHIFKVNIVVEK